MVPSQDHDRRISMKNLSLRDDCQREEHITGSHQVSLRGQSSQLVDGQSNQAKNILKQLEVCTAHPEEAGSVDNRQRKMTEKGREYRKEIIDKKRTNLVSRIIRKSSEIDALSYSHQNDFTVKEELAQLSDIFKAIEGTPYLSKFSPNAGKCEKNAHQNNSEYRHFLRSDKNR